MKILIIDDEEMILKLAGKILERSGFEVALAGSNTEAMSLLRREPRAVEIVVIDWMMADCTGLAMLGQIRDLIPDITAIFSSGHNITEEDIPLALRENTYFLKKPYRAIELVDMVKGLRQIEEKVE